MTKFWAFLLAVAIQTAAAEEAKEKRKITIRSPRPGEHITGDDMWLDASIDGISVPSEGAGMIYMDGNQVGRLEANTARLDVDGIPDLAMGGHEIKIVLVDAQNNPLGLEESVNFVKATEHRKFDSWDASYDDDILAEVEEECNKIPESGVKAPWSDAKGAVRIALGLPVLSAKFTAGSGVDEDMAKGLDIDQYFDNIDELPLFSHFLPTLRDSLNASDTQFSYRIYFGYDVGDPLYDNANHRSAITERIDAALSGLRVSVRWYAYEGMQGKVFWIYNDLFRQAYADGSHYFYMVNDDLRFVTKGWARRFVSELKASPIHVNFGIVGPLDIRDVNKGHMTFGFHHRSHFEIFGEFYPKDFPNWWADNWMSMVYGRNGTKWLKDVQIYNTQSAGQRYSGFYGGQEIYVEVLQRGRQQVLSYCRCLNSGRRWRFAACADL